MKRPSFQFYPKEWVWDIALRQCSIGARGLWADLLCLMHEGTPYGHLADERGAMPLDFILRIVGISEDEYGRLLKELEAHGVFSRTDAGVIFSRRMVRDEDRRAVCRDNGTHGGRPRKILAGGQGRDGMVGPLPVPDSAPKPPRPEPGPGVTPALETAFHRCRELHPNCTDPDMALQILISLVDKGDVTEADAPLMEPGMRKWLESAVWAEGQERFSLEWRKFSAWISGKAWRANPAPSAEAKAARRVVKRSSDGSDPNAEWVPGWKKSEGQ